MSGILRVSNVSKDYPRSGSALRNVSFEMNKGEFVFLVGHSGAGKTTLLRMLSMEERPSSGEVRVSGYSSASIKKREIPHLRRRLGIVFQDFRLLPDRTAEQNVAFALEVTGASHGQIGNKVARLLTQVGLASKATAYPHELSGGEQQRVALARAAAIDPRLILADEPTGELHSEDKANVVALFRRFQREGHTVVIVTHDPEVAAVADRQVEIRDGRVREVA